MKETTKDIVNIVMGVALAAWEITSWFLGPIPFLGPRKPLDVYALAVILGIAVFTIFVGSYCFIRDRRKKMQPAVVDGRTVGWY